jgi:hypothetical protein
MDVPTPCPETARGPRSQGYSWPPTASRVNLLNQGTSRERRASEARQAAQSGDVSRGGGASVEVRARESRVHGRGRQSTSTASKPQGKAMYVAPSSDKGWLLSEQRKLIRVNVDGEPGA